MGNLGYDLSNIDSDQLKQGGKVVWYVKPDGWYRVMVTEAIVKPNKSSTGKVMHTKLTHLDQQYENSFEMAFINIQHEKAKVQEIGQADLKSLAIATGHEDPNHINDTSELINKPFMVNLYSQPNDSNYSDSDGMIQVIGGYLSEDELISREEGSTTISVDIPEDIPPF